MYCISYGGRLKNVCVLSWQSRVASVIFFCSNCSRIEIFVRKASRFHVEISVQKPTCSNSETFENRGLTVLDRIVNFIVFLALMNKFEISVGNDLVCFENATAFTYNNMFVCYNPGVNKLDFF